MAREFVRRYTMLSAVAVTGAGTDADVSGMAVGVVQISGTFVGTITFQGSVDGTNYIAIQATNLYNGAVATTATAAGLFMVPVAGLASFRTYMTWSTGTSCTAIAEFSTASAGLTLADIDVSGTETVTVSSITAGETHIGEVGGADTIITVTPTVTAGAYSAGDAVGGLMTFANAARATGAGGIIKSVVIVDDAGQDAELELWLFDTTFTAVGDNAAFSQTEAELHTVVAVISTEDGAYYATGTPSVCDIEVSRGYTCTGTSLFGQLVTRGTPTYVATDDVTVRIQLVQN